MVLVDRVGADTEGGMWIMSRIARGERTTCYELFSNMMTETDSCFFLFRKLALLLSLRFSFIGEFASSGAFSTPCIGRPLNLGQDERVFGGCTHGMIAAGSLAPS